MCLFLIGAGAPCCDVLTESCGGGVGEAVLSRSTNGGGLARSVAIASMAFCVNSSVLNEVRSVFQFRNRNSDHGVRLGVKSDAMVRDPLTKKM